MHSRIAFALVALCTVLLSGCAAQLTADGTASRALALLPADAILLGERHDAPDHQRIHREVIEALAQRGALAAVALEMADQGRSSAGLAPDAEPAQVRSALLWENNAWPWADYGPAVMAAVRAGVPVIGANLPRAQMRAAMNNVNLDARLPAAALTAQQEAIRAGHCGLLPEGQILPMVRIQVARDVAMAQTVQAAAVAGKTVVLLAGGGHVDRNLGVPQHLPATLQAKSVLLQTQRAEAGADRVDNFAEVWTTPRVPDKDYCAGLRAKLPRSPE